VSADCKFKPSPPARVDNMNIKYGEFSCRMDGPHASESLGRGSADSHGATWIRGYHSEHGLYSGYHSHLVEEPEEFTTVVSFGGTVEAEEKITGMRQIDLKRQKRNQTLKRCNASEWRDGFAHL
jgi:hypothetical protein